MSKKIVCNICKNILKYDGKMVNQIITFMDKTYCIDCVDIVIREQEAKEYKEWCMENGQKINLKTLMELYDGTYEN